ncbi:MAG: hypothetical protein QNK36_05190 [Colwellia sp.]|nr:hypothetical protein [Colwellia sp.]
MFKCVISMLLFSIVSFNAVAITPTFSVIREIHFGIVMLDTGSCRMIASTGVLISYSGQFICVLPEDAHNGRYTVTANPNKTIRFKILPNLDTGDGVVFNPYVELISDGVPGKVISNNVGFVDINSGATGIVDLYVGGILTVTGSYSHSQTVIFSFPDSIEWFEVP